MNLIRCVFLTLALFVSVLLTSALFVIQTHTVNAQFNNSCGGGFCKSNQTTSFPPLAPYEGIVATRSLLAVNFDTTNKQIMAVRAHIARDHITSLKLRIPGFYMGPSIETPTGCTATITAAIEYPVGTVSPIQVKFSGVAQGSVPDGGLLLSDATIVDIPDGAIFNERLYGTNACGIIFVDGSSGNISSPSFFSEGIRVGVSGVPDQTMGGTVAFTSQISSFSSVSILATTTKASVYAGGDSKVWGQRDFANASGDVGEIARSIGSFAGYINAGWSGERADQFLFNSPMRQLIAANASHIITNYGGNDLAQTVSSAATIFGYIQGYQALFPTKVNIQSTNAPQTSTTDSWSTPVNCTGANNQTPLWNPRFVQLNALIRTLPRFIENDAVVGCGADLDTWQGGATPDGLHETMATYIKIQNSGILSQANVH